MIQNMMKISIVISICPLIQSYQLRKGIQLIIPYVEIIKHRKRIVAVNHCLVYLNFKRKKKTINKFLVIKSHKSNGIQPIQMSWRILQALYKVQQMILFLVKIKKSSQNSFKKN